LSFCYRQHLGFGFPFLLCIASASAQTTPDAGALRQQIERQIPQTLPGEQKPLTALPPEYKPAPGLAVTVKQFRFDGHTRLTAEQLAPALVSFTNRPLDFAGLQQAMAAVSEAYRAAGWLVRVYLPRQDITDGIVTLQIVEGVLGKVIISDPLPLRFSSELAQAHVAAAQPTGRALNATALDRALLLLDDLPGIAVSGNLAPGAGEAETDLILKLGDEALASGEAGLDNTGARSTGALRLTFSTMLSSPLKIGDQLTANLIHSEGSDYARVAYSLPIGYDGLRLGVNASRLDYEVIAPEFKAANIRGNSTSLGLDALYPLIRSRARNVYLSGAFDDKAFDNRANGATSTHYGVRSFGVGLMGNIFDSWGGGGANMASINLTAGAVDLNGSPNKATDATTTQTHGDFTKLRYALSRQQALTGDLSLYALLTGQFANKNLDSSEKFFLGGSSGVRAYPSSEGGGSEGTLLNLELRWRAQPNLVVTGFYDWGSVMVNKNNNFTGAPALNRFELDGAGVSVAWTGPIGLALKGTYARRWGNNPNPDATTGNDQDGTLMYDRFWVTASLPF
jgi:hemolysin activation/secretion protein